MRHRGGLWLRTLAPAVVVAAMALPAPHADAAPAAARGAATAGADPSRGSLLYATDFDPASFNQTLVGSDATLTGDSKSTLVCTVGSAGSKMIASVKNWSVSEPAAIWAEYDVSAASLSGGYQSGFYFEGSGGDHRHLHIDFAADTVTLRDPNYNNEGPLVSVPNLGSGATFHFVVVDTSPRYRVYVNGSLIIDYTDSFAASTPGGLGFDCASANNGTGSHSITNLSVYTVAGTCATGWTCADIGAPSPPGSASESNGVWSVQGGGSDVFGTADSFQYDWQPAGGAVSVAAHVTSQSNTSTWAKAGVMLRASSDPGSPDYQIFVTPSNGIAVQYRTTQGGTTSQAVDVGGAVPAYLEVTVSGTGFNAYTSPDGSAWTAVSGAARAIAFGSSPLLAGLMVTSHNSSELGTVTFDTVSVTASSVCAAGWTCADVGSPALAGGATTNGGAWTVQGGGGDIWGTADQFQYDYQPLSGGGSITAHVTSQTNTSSWAKAGVMLRASTKAGSPDYQVFVTPGNGIAVQYRGKQGGSTSQAAGLSGAVPAYLRITLTGTTFKAYTSPDGVTWTVVKGSGHTLAFGSSPLLAGLMVTSHNASALCTVTFDGVSVS